MSWPIDPNAPTAYAAGDLVAPLAIVDDVRERIRADDNSQAARTKFRLLKARLRSHMVAVDVMLAKIDELGRANVVTKEDLRRLREVRDLLHEARAQGLEMTEDANG
jgi:hypothetical protein